MSLEKLISYFKEEFETDIIDSTDFLDESSKTIDIYGVIQTTPLEILKDDPIALKSAQIKWFDEFYEESEVYLGSIEGIWQNKNRFNELVSAIKARDIIPFIGSGMSADSGFPIWKDFLRSLRRFGNVSEERFNDLLSKSQYDILATELCDSMDATITAEVMRNVFQVDRGKFTYQVDGPVRLLPIIFNDLILTTNYDNVIEAVYNSFSVHFTVLLGTRIEDYRPLQMSQLRVLLKLHGDLFIPRSRILIKEEYDAIYTDESDYIKVLEDIYASHQILFLGCSLDNDRTLKVFESVFRSGRVYKQHYAFLRAGDEDEDISVVEQNIRPQDNYLRSIGIYPIWYLGKHSEAITNLLINVIAKGGLI